MYRLLHLRNPRMAVQPFVKFLFDFIRLPTRSYVFQQFSICFDIYMEICQQVRSKVLGALGHDTLQWRVKHSCPPCTYSLQDEQKLCFSRLVTYDGNDSAKRVLRQRKGDGDEADIVERTDSHHGGGNYFLSRQEVDKWAKENIEDMLRLVSYVATLLYFLTDMQVVDEFEENPCADCWHNMANDVSSRMWGIFDETGMFVAVCRHGFILIVADMVRSGELAKYPLAVLEYLLQALEDGLGAGYDVGCKFAMTVDRSPLGKLAKEKKFKSLIGLFHGHAHCQLCQLRHLGTYVEGLGLSDLEGCERLFSRTNELAGVYRYASAFHRHQSLRLYFEHLDEVDTPESLSKWRCTGYHYLHSLKAVSW